MDTIIFTHDDRLYTARIIPELPDIGDPFTDEALPVPALPVLEVAPWPPTGQQESPEVYAFSTWRLHLKGGIYHCVAVHEPEAENM